MKTRIIHTKYWKDQFVQGLSPIESYSFVYLITNDKINICGIYELSDREAVFDLRITNEEWAQVKTKLQEADKVDFLDGWVRIRNIDKYNRYVGEKNDIARNRELSVLPDKLKELWLTDTSIHTSIDTHGIVLEIRNKKSEIRNQESEDGGGIEKLRDKINELGLKKTM
jgi:hypothetical protein